MYNKEGRIQLETTAHIQNRLDTNIQFYNTDIGTADLVFNITRNGSPLLVSSENADVFLILKNGKNYIVDNVEPTDPMNGRLKFTIPNEFLGLTGKVNGQLYIAVHGKEDIVTEVEFSFKIADSLINTIPAVDKINEIRTFQEFRENIMTTINEINEALANGEDYVSQMEGTKASGMKALNDRTTQAIEEITTLVGTSKQEITDLKENTITELDDKSNQIKADIEQLNQYDTSNWQKYKMTNDDGSRKYVQGLDLLTAPPGQYESTQTVNGPLKENGEPDTGFVESDISVSSNGRRVIMATRSSYNKTYIKTLHTNGVDSGWKELTKDNTRVFLGTIGSEGNEYTSLLQLPPGYYECTIPSDAISVDAPQDPNGASYLAAVDVYNGAVGNRKVLRLIMNSRNDEYRATVHTSTPDNPNGQFRGWKKVQNEEEYNALFDDTGWIDWNTMNGATKRETDNPNALQCQRRIRTVNGVKIAHLRININNIKTNGQVVGSIPSSMVSKKMSFIIRAPISFNPPAVNITTDGNFTVNINTADFDRWLPSHYVEGEFSWIIDDIGGGQ
ncbi:BppU family phage baseplate upper protein [Mammaliicoccus lentus]|uniref:BppU family phage baseplate upper protein n=1 Tax=Mammaliicoccus lentus TaxID=42858 RepID=UPI0026495F91|nr:BppU family phage baseplate upper protein [Mammaliicoccus lentus]